MTNDKRASTNSELCNHIFGNPEAQLWGRLKEFAESKNLLEPNFEQKSADNFHACFWELCLAKVLVAAGISLKRAGSDTNSLPDFYFSNGERKIWIEAVACGEPEERNAVPAPADEPDEFLSGIAPEHKIIQRLANSICTKINKYAGYAKSFLPEDRFVIALNGYRALNGHPHDQAPFTPPFIVRTLFGLGDQRISQHGEYFEYSDKTQQGAPIAHLINPANKNIAGVLYSAANIWETGLPLGRDFIFIQNPLAPDISDDFNVCVKGRWVRSGPQGGKFKVHHIRNSSERFEEDKPR